jgi:hypothetical protein
MLQERKSRGKFPVFPLFCYPVLMWPFGGKGVQERLEQLETAVRELKGQRKVLEDEWEQVYEKYRTAMSKLARRDMREASPAGKDAPGSTNGNQLDPPLTLMDVRARMGNRGLLPRG